MLIRVALKIRVKFCSQIFNTSFYDFAIELTLTFDSAVLQLVIEAERNEKKTDKNDNDNNTQDDFYMLD